ncbi:MAG: hypothetical protein ACKVON_06115 [Beijerinckiaceae bacterium]
MVLLVDHDYINVLAIEPLRCLKTGEASTNDHNPGPNIPGMPVSFVCLIGHRLDISFHEVRVKQIQPSQ